MAFDAHQEWVGSFGDGRPEKVRVEAASWQGKPVYFKITGDWQPPQAANGNPVALVLLLAAMLVGSTVVAWRNLRLGRSDRRGAGQIAVVVLLITFCGWL